MRYRIALWAAVGFLVAAFWAVYAFPTFLSADTPWFALAHFTQPVLAIAAYFHFGVRFYWALLANTATYALAGLIVESLRRTTNPAN